MTQATTKRSFRIGIDIGGTFTDIVLIGADGTVFTRKVSSTPDDYSRGIAAGIAEILDAHAIAPDEIEDVVHATTVATNAVLENKGARTGLITTTGFRDVLEFRRVRVPELYNLAYVKPTPLVPRGLRLEVRERLGPDGSVRVPLDEATVITAAQRLSEAAVEAVAICLLHSYANPVHEHRVAELVREVLPPDVFISTSYEILPEIREYERTSTTVVNAYLGPVMRRYLAALTERLAALGIRRPLHIMQSSGGQMGIAAAITKPAYLVESGPAAGVIAAARTARQAGLPDVITLDIGGTTAKTAMVENGEPTKTGEYEVGAGINLSSKLVRGAGYAIKLPFIDVSEIGAGGGSHVWFDKGGMLKVGPQSAGSVPGPICYGKGGEHVTLTDALLALGYISPSYLVGGALRLQPELTLREIAAQVGRVLGKPLVEAAFGIYTVAVSTMVRAVKSVSTNRGRDPRDYTLIAFGGNGPIVAAAIAQALTMKRVLIPPHPGVLSSFGLLVADSTQEMVRSLPGLLDTLSAEAIGRAYDALAATAVQALCDEGVPSARIVTARLADLRYAGQAFELTVPVGDGLPDRAAIAAAFHDEHRRTYGHKAEDQPVEFVSIRVVARAPTQALPARAIGSGDQGPAPGTVRQAYFGRALGSRPTPVIGRGDLAGGQRPGPLIVEEYDSTIVVPPDATAHLDDAGNVILSLDARP